MAITKEEIAAAGARIAIAQMVGNPLKETLQHLANTELTFTKIQRQSFRAQYLLTVALIQQAFVNIREIPDPGDAELRLGDAHQAQATLKEALELIGAFDRLLAGCSVVGDENAATGVTSGWSDEDWAIAEAKATGLVQQIRAKLDEMP